MGQEYLTRVLNISKFKDVAIKLAVINIYPLLWVALYCIVWCWKVLGEIISQYRVTIINDVNIIA